MLKNVSLQTLFSICLLFFYSELAANDAPIILPGAPGEESKNLDAEDATNIANTSYIDCLLYTSPSPRDMRRSRMPSSA